MTLKIKNLSKTYSNGVKALNDLSLEIPKGMFGLLGPNGAGKSSLMRSIATLQTPDSGMIEYGEIDVLKQPEEFRKVLGYLPQEFGVYPRASALDLLNHMAVLKGITSKSERKELVDALLERVNLYVVRKKSVAGFSGGMRQRFGIAQALIGDPQVVIVDEPTAGLDPGERNRFYNLLSEIGENVAVILSTHIVQDVQQLCQNMAIVNHGSVLFQGKPEDAHENNKGVIWEEEIEK
ncbi:MAG: ABC transporter ATP-binding protein, partial [Saprospiraceae bacterium]|nr:ABC transporter ATP-binding protein [Saprospiraceae bacterium]